jgi:hypothetical protein
LQQRNGRKNKFDERSSSTATTKYCTHGLSHWSKKVDMHWTTLIRISTLAIINMHACGIYPSNSTPTTVV